MTQITPNLIRSALDRETDRSFFLRRHLDLPDATGDPDARWEKFQFALINNDSLLSIDTKARQAGWSWTAAANAVAEGWYVPRSVHIFVSINQDEASEKIRYAKQIIEALDRDFRPSLVIDNRFELEFENGTRLISHPCRPVRGKPKARIYLDEFAHYPKDREIYTAALPATTKGGYLRIGSSPLGAGGMFWEIYAQKLRAYPGFKRGYAPWWTVRALCRDVANAVSLAPTMLTEERVRLFGTQRIIEIFENMLLEDFQQEYECAWVDESIAWITWDEIKKNQIDDQDGKLLCWQAKNKDDALRVIADVVKASKEKKIEDVFAGGMDVGRTRNTTEIFLIGKGASSQTPLRLMITLDNIEFDDQKEVATKAMQFLPVTKFLIDKNGIGMQLAEQLHKIFGVRAEGFDFTNASKEILSVDLKLRMQKGQVPIPLDRDLSYQIHSIKKKVSAAKNNIFDTTANEKHHADKYWALALAVKAANTESVELKTAENPFF